jgi:hypothetical protein
LQHELPGHADESIRVHPDRHAHADKLLQRLHDQRACIAWENALVAGVQIGGWDGVDSGRQASAYGDSVEKNTGGCFWIMEASQSPVSLPYARSAGCRQGSF